MIANQLAEAFNDHAIFRLEENLVKIQKCVALIDEEQTWQRPNNASNSIGNQLLHLCGNMTQYIISGLGGAPDIRQRAEEFSAKEGAQKEALVGQLSEVVNKSVAVIKAMTAEELIRVRTVQGYAFSGAAVLLHAVEHFSYHAGQIAFWTKFLKDRDLKFYDDEALN